MDHRRILVADRNQSFLDKTKEILAAEEIEIIQVTTGSRVLGLCQQDMPDAALLHVDLPSLPGTELCHRIKTQVDPGLPVVLMFSEETRRAADIASQCKADNFLIRPLKKTELLFCVRSALQLRKITREMKASARIEGERSGKPSGMVSLDMFHNFLTLELRRVDRYGFPLSLLAIGVDPLPEDAGVWSKALDEQLGPALASAIRSTLRDIDLSTVINNRELLVLMPHTDREGAGLVAKRICRTISAQAYHFGRARIQPTVSVGVACLHGERATAEELLARVKAHRARAADAGGNKVFTG
jgi:two-component system cell cycle response regulator